MWVGMGGYPVAGHVSADSGLRSFEDASTTSRCLECIYGNSSPAKI